MKLTKRIISAAVSGMMMISAVNVTAFGSYYQYDEEQESDDMGEGAGERLYDEGSELYYFKIDSNNDGIYNYVQITYDTASVDNYRGMTHLTIPETIEDLPVLSIDAWAFAYSSTLSEIDIPDSIYNIGRNAFYGTPYLQGLRNRFGIKYAGKTAVIADKNISVAVIREGMKGIAAGAFEGCSGLTSVVFPYSLSFMGNKAFSKCTSLTDIILPECISCIPTGAFSECTSLEEITVSGYVKSIDNEAFYGCTSMKDITIKNPECVIYDNANTISSGDNGFEGMIHGYIGSTAQTYAEKYGYRFEAIDAADEQDRVPGAVKGDANGDGVLNVRDAAFIANVLSQKMPDRLPLSTDFNLDGKTDIRDAASIANYLRKRGASSGK